MYLDNQEWIDNITSGEYERYYEVRGTDNCLYGNRKCSLSQLYDICLRIGCKEEYKQKISPFYAELDDLHWLLP